MRNLVLLDSSYTEQEDARGAQCTSVDCDTGQIYCATDSQLIGLDARDGQVLSCVSLREDGYLPGDGAARVVAIQYLADQQALCVAISDGHLLLWNVTFGQLECVGSVESGITAMGWSPDLELLLITTGADTFIMMTREFDPITETSLHTSQFGEAEFVEVGWGKKETQFHGSEGKSAARTKVEEVRPAQPWDDQLPRVTWRGDGQYFAVSSISGETGARTVRVWSRDGIHHSTSENVDGIEQALAWKPSGSLIATSQRRPNKHDIAFFEKNGLRHGEFTLPFEVNQVKVREVLWNLDSSVLAVWCEDMQEGQSNTYVQLWTTGNYHWYQKQSLLFGAEHIIVAIVWDPEHAYRMHIMSTQGQYFQYTWAWATSRSDGSDDQALAAVIDGVKVLMTPMKQMVVPPPMSAYQLHQPMAVNQVVFAPPPDSGDCAMVLVDGSIAVYRFCDVDATPEKGGVSLGATGGTGFSRQCRLPTLIRVFSTTGLDNNRTYPLSRSHFTWLSCDVISLCTVSTTTPQHSVLHKAQIEGDKFVVKNSIDLEGCVYGTALDTDSGNLAVQLTDGSLLKYCVADNSVLPWETSSGLPLQFPLPCSQMAVCEVGGETVVLGLTERYRFYVNDTEVASNCTSFAVHDEFLLLTTLTHTCRCISRHTKVKVIPTLSDGKAHPFDESVRRVERGSRIVMCVADDTKLVLQMPRGNLETVHPRALILSAVRKRLDRLEFGRAFEIMRKHRINMNLLYDHNPAAFLGNVTCFVEQVAAVNHINLFLTDLQEADMTKTMYTGAYPPTSMTEGVGDVTSKVDVICDAVRAALYSIDENKYLLSILTTYVRKSRPELEQALQLVRKLRDVENEMPGITAEDVLKYLLFLVDVNELYDIALGTYDFDLVLMVAEKSQKDPKEYIPFLNELRRLETNYQRYTIDKHLKRYSKALKHITKCGADHFQESLSLIANHRLHTQALQLHTPGSQEYKEIATSYGNLLSGKKQHEEAAILYVKAEQWQPALESFKSCNQWQQVFCMAARLKYSPEQDIKLAKNMAEDLKMRGRHGDAAIVLEQYAQDSEEAIVTLIQGGLMDEAQRLMYKYRRTDFIETDLKPRLLEMSESHMTTLEDMRSEFEKHKSRLAVVKQDKEKARLELLETGGAGQDPNSDLFSDTSSATGESIQSSRYSESSSVYSKMSGRSAKNRRKAEHKKWRLKEGSEFEDFALIAAMAKTVTYVDGLREEIKTLTHTLCQFHYDRQAMDLQHRYDDFLTYIAKSIPQIWIGEERQSEFKPVLGPNATANEIALAMQQGGAIQSESDTELDPVIRIAPILRKDIKWKLYALDT